MSAMGASPSHQRVQNFAQDIRKLHRRSRSFIDGIFALSNVILDIYLFGTKPKRV